MARLTSSSMLAPKRVSPGPAVAKAPAPAPGPVMIRPPPKGGQVTIRSVDNGLVVTTSDAKWHNTSEVLIPGSPDSVKLG